MGINYKSNIVLAQNPQGWRVGRSRCRLFPECDGNHPIRRPRKNARTLDLGRTQVNYIGTRKREHSRKPDEQYPLIESCSPGLCHLEMFGRGVRKGWSTWGNQAEETYEPTWDTYSHNSKTTRVITAG